MPPCTLGGVEVEGSSEELTESEGSESDLNIHTTTSLKAATFFASSPPPPPAGADVDTPCQLGAELPAAAAQLGPPVGGVAPLELTTQFLTCLMSEDFEAAQSLCKKSEFSLSLSLSAHNQSLYLWCVQLYTPLSSLSPPV